MSSTAPVKEKTISKVLPLTMYEAWQAELSKAIDGDLIDLIEKAFDDAEARGIDLGNMVLFEMYRIPAVAWVNQTLKKLLGIDAQLDYTVDSRGNFELIYQDPQHKNFVTYCVPQLIVISEFGRDEKIFKLTQGITEMLLNTDLKNVAGKYVQPPFDSFMISLPTNLGLEYNEIYMIFDDMGDARGIHFVMVDSIRETSKPVYTKYIYLDDEKDIFEQLHTEFDKMRHSIMNFERVLKGDTDISPEEKITELIELAVNTILYINSTKPEMVNIKPIRSFAKTRKESKLPAKELGSSIRLSSSVITVSSMDTSSEKRTYQVSDKIWWQRGHWRKQKHGKGRTLIKVIWIEPQLKGHKNQGEDPKLHNRSYHVK